MATVSERLHDSTIGAGRRRWSTLRDQLAHISPWLVVVAYVVVYSVTLVSTAIAALYVGALIPGVAGAVVFFTAGLAVFASAPTAVRRLFISTMDAIEASREV